MNDARGQPLSELAIQLVVELWGGALGRLEHHLDPAGSGEFRRTWAAVCNDLADSYPTLDPFAPELAYRDGTLHREVDDLDPDFIEALVVATRRIASRYRLAEERLQGVLSGDDPMFRQPQVIESAGLNRLWNAGPKVKE